MKIKKTYKFALKSSLYLTILMSFLFGVLFVLFEIKNSYWLLLIFSILLFSVSFFIIQYRVEKFIYKRIKKIYDSVSLLEPEQFKTNSISTIETLEKEVEKFAREKQKQIKSLNERENYRREFLGNVSHELKTPLFTVQGYLLTLLEGAIEDKSIRTKYITRANKGVERLTAIVKDLDLISRLETSELRVKYKHFNIVELVQNVFDLLEMKAKKRNISLRLKKNYIFPIKVDADIEKIEQVLINLLVNSIKYGKIGGTTTVSIDSNENDKISISVKDDGEGVKKEHLPRLFERFYRVDRSRSRDQGGSGLGLAIVKHIIEAHNETIILKSDYGKGTEFSFTLKRAK